MHLLGLDTGALCTGSSNLLVDLASIFVNIFCRTYARVTRLKGTLAPKRPLVPGFCSL